MLLVKLIEPPCTERYARWCERSGIYKSPPTRFFLTKTYIFKVFITDLSQIYRKLLNIKRKESKRGKESCVMEQNNNNNSNNNNTSDSLYSYSYINEDNQERNPNYYEKQESGNQNYTNSGAYTNTYTDGNAYNNPQQGKKPKKAKMKKKHGFGGTVGKAAAVALVFGMVSGATFYGTGYAIDYANGKVTTTSEKTVTQTSSNTKSSGSISATNVSTATTVNDVSDIAENVMPSIVSITNMGQQTVNFFGQQVTQDVEGAGSGIIIGQTDDAIYIATNNHVVANSTQLTVNFIDDQSVAAEIKGTDTSTDLAVISVAVSDIPKDTLSKIKVATLGDSDSLKVGEGTVAIGNALGYGQSVTTGVISALNREVTVQDENTGTSVTNDLIQTSAAINPGNSGGALLNMKGEVIGINSVKYSDEQVEGMGFAIPISQAEPIINDLINREVVDDSNSAYLGVAGQDVTSDIAKAYGMPEGIYVTQVKEGTAAEAAGIQKGDIITKFDGKKVSSMEALRDNMQYYAAGTTVEVVVQTNQNGEWQEQTLSVTLGKKNG